MAGFTSVQLVWVAVLTTQPPPPRDSSASDRFDVTSDDEPIWGIGEVAVVATVGVVKGGGAVVVVGSWGGEGVVARVEAMDDTEDGETRLPLELRRGSSWTGVTRNREKRPADGAAVHPEEREKKRKRVLKRACSIQFSEILRGPQRCPSYRA